MLLCVDFVVFLNLSLCVIVNSLIYLSGRSGLLCDTCERT